MKNIPYSQIFIAFSASIATLIFGILIGWSSPVIPILLENSDFNFSLNEAAWATSVLSLGESISCIPAGIIRNQYGTKTLIVTYSVPSIIGWLMLTYASNSWMIILGRFFGGIAGGGLLFIAPIYIGETSSKQFRGALVGFIEVNLKVGVLLAYAIGSVSTPKNLNIFGLSVVIAYLIISLVLPETPVFLLKCGKNNEARKVLKFLRKNDHNIEEELKELQQGQEIFSENSIELLKIEKGQKITDVNESFQIKNSNALKSDSKEAKLLGNHREVKFRNDKISLRSQLKNDATRKAFSIMIFLFFIFQNTGINSILFYSSKILIESGINMDKFSSSLLLGVIQVIAVFLAMIFLDFKGRRFLLISSFIIMAVGQLLNGIYFHLKNLDFDVSNFKWIPLFSLSIYLIGFNSGLAPVTFVFMGELFSIQAKKVFAPLGMTANLFFSFIVTLAFPFLVKAIGIHLIFYFFSFSCLVGLIFTLKYIPETKGKSLAEIQKILSRKLSNK